MAGCGQTSARWLPSTMPSPPSTRPSGSRERRSSAFIREDSGIARWRRRLISRLQQCRKTKFLADYIPATELLQLKPLIADFFKETFMPPETKFVIPAVFYRTLSAEGLEIFYREAGPRDAPTVLLLHGFPSSSHMFRNLIPMLADQYHVVAPDFPGYGESSAPSVNDFDYSYERLATVTEKFTEKLNLSSYALYLSDIGASVGFRLAVMHPERVTAMIVQNGDAHVEAINKEFSKGLFDYWEEYFRRQQPPTLITWGKNDGIFTVEGAELYKRDIPSAELHLFDTGHFALEEEVDRIGSLMHEFLERTINKQ